MLFRSAFLVDELGRRVREEGLRIVGIPTSDRTQEHARRLNIPLSTFAEHTQIDLTIDGADEVELRTLNLIKGHGGALLREKIVAAASKRMAVVVDQTKLVRKLGSIFAVPVEVVPFGWQVTQGKLQRLKAKTTLRMGPANEPYVTDGGHYIIDCAFGPMKDPREIARELDRVVGVVEHGLFLGLASQVFVGGSERVEILKKKLPRRPLHAARN